MNLWVKKKRERNVWFLFDLDHGLPAADELTWTVLQHLDLVTTDLTEVDLVHFGHFRIKSENVQRRIKIFTMSKFILCRR